MLISSSLYFSEMIQVDIRLVKRSILTLQRYIYREARKYNIKSTYALQKQILLKKEITLFVLFKILKEMKKEFFFSSLYYKKFLTFIYFILINRVKMSLPIVQIIKLRLSHDILLLLLKPKWLVKLERCFFINQSKRYIAIISQHISKILIKSKDYKKISKIALNPFLDLKNIKLKRWLKKVDNNTSIIKWLYNYLIQQKYINNTFVLIDDFFRLTNSIQLSELLKVIYFNGLEWFLYTNKINKIIYSKLYITYHKPYLVIVAKKLLINKLFQQIGQFINLQFCNLKKLHCKIYQYSTPYLSLHTLTVRKTKISEYIIKPSKQSIKLVIHKIRSTLYCKDQNGYWRARADTPIYKGVLLIEYLLNSWYSYYFSLISNIDILRLNNIIDNLLYSWQIKK